MVSVLWKNYKQKYKFSNFSSKLFEDEVVFSEFRILGFRKLLLDSFIDSQQENDDYFLLILRFKHVLKDCRLWCVSFQIRSQNAQVAQQFSG